MPLVGSITFIYTHDMAASRKFYQEALELPVRSDKGPVVFYALPGTGSSLGVVEEGISAATTPPCSAKAAGRDTVMLCLLTDDVDGTHARALKHSAASVQLPRENARFGIYNALVRDPDGYLVELQTFLDPQEQSAFAACAADAHVEEADAEALAEQCVVSRQRSLERLLLAPPVELGPPVVDQRLQRRGIGPQLPARSERVRPAHPGEPIREVVEDRLFDVERCRAQRL